jgi:hypothetical protein
MRTASNSTPPARRAANSLVTSRFFTFPSFRASVFFQTAHHTDHGDGYGIVEMLYTSSLVALVGSGNSPNCSPRKLVLMNIQDNKIICELNFLTAILAVKMNRRRSVLRCACASRCALCLRFTFAEGFAVLSLCSKHASISTTLRQCRSYTPSTQRLIVMAFARSLQKAIAISSRIRQAARALKAMLLCLISTQCKTFT